MAEHEVVRPAPPKGRERKSARVGGRLSESCSKLVRELQTMFPESTVTSNIEEAVKFYHDYWKANGNGKPSPAMPKVAAKS